MVRRMRQLWVAGAMVGALLALTTGSLPVSAAIADRAFTVLGCEVGDYTCFYAKMGGGGSNDAYFCRNGYYTCENGVPVATVTQTAGAESQYCAGGAAYLQNGTYGCRYGNPIGVDAAAATNGIASGSNGAYPTIIVAGNFASAGQGAANTTGAARP